MRMNRFFAVAALALAAVACAVASKATAAYGRAMAAVHSAWGIVRDRLRIAPASQPGAARSDLNPVALLVAAKAFMGRLTKRERPRVTPLWRMCPSI